LLVGRACAVGDVFQLVEGLSSPPTALFCSEVMMAKYRLLMSHYLETGDGTQSVLLPGDKENETVTGPEGGTVVGDGTLYKVHWPTLYMEPLDDEARDLIRREEKRIADNRGALDPVEALPISDSDKYEDLYIPGFEGRQRKPALPHGASVVTKKVPE
jgi:hypothetical protein